MPPRGGFASLRAVIVGDFSFWELMGAMAIFFAWVIWIAFIFMVLLDVYRRPGNSGWAKVGWTLFVVFVPLIGALVYIIRRPDFAPFGSVFT